MLRLHIFFSIFVVWVIQCCQLWRKSQYIHFLLKVVMLRCCIEQFYNIWSLIILKCKTIFLRHETQSRVSCVSGFEPGTVVTPLALRCSALGLFRVCVNYLTVLECLKGRKNVKYLLLVSFFFDKENIGHRYQPKMSYWCITRQCMLKQKPRHEVKGIVRRAPRQDCVEAQICERVPKNVCSIEGPQEHSGLHHS